MTDPDTLQQLVELFDSPAWEILEATAKERREAAITRLLTAKPEDCPPIQAEVRTLDWLLDLPDDARRQYQRATKRPERAGKEE